MKNTVAGHMKTTLGTQKSKQVFLWNVALK